jgi:PBSX family phage terminase large subunit
VKLEMPVGKQRRSILGAHHRINIWGGSIRAGKTIASIIAWLDFIARGPEGDLLMAGKTERTLKRNALDTITDIVGPDQCRVNWGMGEARIMGRRVYIVGANDQRAEEKLRGLTLAGAYGDELTTWYSDFFGMLLSRLSVRGARGYFTTNPDTPSHWLKRDWLDRAEQIDLAYFHFTLDDNPNLDAEYVAQIKREYVGGWYKRYILGLWVPFTGPIYDAWDEGRFVVSECPPLLRRWMAVDYGRYNPFVAQLQGLGDDGRVYVAAEYRYDGRQQKRQKSENEYVQEVVQWLASPEVTLYTGGEMPEWTFVDPSARSFLTALWLAEIQGVTPADNDVATGLQLVASALSPEDDRLRVHASCKGLRAEFPTYSWDPKAADRGVEQPLKKEDHSLDALRYGLMGSRLIWRGAAVTFTPQQDIAV